MPKLEVPVKQPDGSFNHGPIGGFTYPDGTKALIYQCGKCGELCKYNTGLNAHMKKQHDPNHQGEQWGWADGPPDWQELDITVEMIVN